MAPSELFAKMAAALDSNRKIRRAGRNGREVYLWVLRQVALRNSDGDVPLEDVTDFEHVAEQLMCSQEEARIGFERCVTVALLGVTDGRCFVVGWDEDWGRRSLSNAERQARHRANKSSRAALRDNSTDESNGAVVTSNGAVVTSNGAVTRNGGEERRGEEREARVTHADPPSRTEAFHLDTNPQRAAKPARPRQVKHPLPDDWSPSLDLQAECRALGFDPADQATRMRNWARSEGARKADWNGTYQNWIRREADKAPRRFNGHASGPLPEV